MDGRAFSEIFSENYKIIIKILKVNEFDKVLLRVPLKPEFCLHGGRFFRLMSADVLFHQATEQKF